MGQGNSGTSPDVRMHVERRPEILERLGETDVTEIGGLSTHLTNVEAQRFAAAQGQQELLSLKEIEDKIKLLDHQLDAAHRALFQMGGGALFADEVGLGKTIEVGMALKEMDFRETHKTFLILTPAQLAPQWQEELDSKFDLDFVCNYDEEFGGFDDHDKVVSSIDTAKTKSHIDDILERRWDVLVLDEAHYIKNEDTKRYELIEELDYGHAYFATATPIQNDITDLYNIVRLIRPGLLGSREEFRRQFVPKNDDAQIKNGSELQRRLNRVMIRNRREETDIDFTNRRVQTNTFEPTRDERDVYDAVTNYVRQNYTSEGAKHLVMLMLQKEAVSSPYAVLGTIEKWLNDPERSAPAEREQLYEIETLIDGLGQTTKQKKLANVVEGLEDNLNTTRAVVFTQFRPTQDAIADYISGRGHPVHVVNGDVSSKGKKRIIDKFEEEGGVMVATDSISEGQNMQFCNVLVNYDLPWNPMKVEQRIGRVDRIGQNKDVYVFNLALEGTVEEQVLDKLYGKIDLFNQSIGGLRDVLSRMEKSGSDFEREVFDRLRTADDEVELENNFEEMAVDLEKNKEAAEKMADFNKDVFGTFEFTGGTA